MKFRLGRIIPAIFLSAVFIFVAGKNGARLFYQPSGKASIYNHYLEGSVLQNGESKNLHLQFTRNWQLKKSKGDKYLLQEWGQKYQGSDFNLSEAGLPGPEERVEKIIDSLGRVEKVARYPAGHRYYLNLLVFPDHPVSAGNSWKYDYQINFDFAGKTVPTSCQAIYQLEKILVYRTNYRCAKILINGFCRSGPDQELTIDYRFQGKVFFDLDQGREVDYQLSYSWSKTQPAQNLKEAVNLELYSLLER